MRIMVGLSVLVLVSLAATAQADDEKEKKISVSDCPNAVQKTLKREARGGEIEEIEKETEGDSIVYEVEVEFGENEYEIEIAEDGTLLSKVLEEEDGDDEDEDEEDDEDADDEEDEDEEDAETPVNMADLPKSVQKTLKRESRGGEIEEIEKESEGDKVVYEAEVEFGQKEYEIEIAEDGTLLSKVLEEDGDDEDEHEEDEDEEDEDEED